AGGSRSELHPALNPADDLSGGQLSCDPIDQLVVVQSQIGCLLLCQEPLDFLVREGRAEQRPLHRVVAAICFSWLFLELMPRRQGGADGSACVTGSRLDPHTFERPFSQDSPIPNTVEGHASRQTEIL